MANYSITAAEITAPIAEAFIRTFGSPLVLGLFLVAMFFIYAKFFGIGIEGLGIVAVAALILISSVGLIPEWVGYLTIIVVAAFAGLVIGGRI